MNAPLRLLLLILSLAMAMSQAVGPRFVSAQESSSPASDTDRERVHPKVLEFLKPMEPAADDDELVQKMKERHNLAATLLGSRVKEYQRNASDLVQVLDAARLVLDAKLDLATDRDSQLAVYEGALEVAGLIEQHFQKLHDAGLGKVSDLQRAQLARVSVELQILKLKRQP